FQSPTRSARASRGKRAAVLVAVPAAAGFALAAGLALLSLRAADPAPPAAADAPTATNTASPAPDGPALPPGHADRGRQLFSAPAASCISCHRRPGEGGYVGPDLAGVGRRRSREYLLDAVLRPNKDLAPGYGEVLLTTTAGAELAGDFLSEDADG